MDLPQPIRVLFLVSEADPFVKVGGLGDVGGSLPRAINRLNHLTHSQSGDNGQPNRNLIDIRVVIPYHGTVAKDMPGLRPLVSFNVPHIGGSLPALAYDQDMEGVPVYLISGDPIPSDGPIYNDDPTFDGDKYTFFSMASLELVKALGWQPHLIHANDWHTAPAIYAARTHPEEAAFANTSTLIGIHNLPYLGYGTSPSLSAYGLPTASESPLPEWAKHLPLPLALLTADHIVAVSPSYADEILTAEFGSGLHNYLQDRAASLSGILNGFDQQLWDPMTDPHLVANYNYLSLNKRLANKRALKVELGLYADTDIPLLAMVTRMESQKGVDLALDALRQLDILSEGMQLPWQAIILGTGSHSLEEAARRLQADYPDRVRAIIAFDPPLSRRIFAGADALLIPSRYEPCGLVQMIAMRYGCIPIARAVGGLKDTIQPYYGHGGTGFLFLEPTPEALSGTIRDALALYTDRNAWRKLQHEGMIQDFSWERSAQQYLSLYRSLICS
jgi:starch synthase